MSDAALSPPLPSDEITDNASCLRCEYNLRGLTWSGRCPECGTPTEHSRWKFTLSNTNPQWVKTQRDGVLYLFAGFTLGAVSYVFPYAGIGLAYLVLNVINMLLNLIGAWRLTALNSDTRLTTPAPRLRILMRACALMDVVNLFGVIVGSGWGMRIFIPFWVTMPVWLVAYEARCLYLVYLTRYFDRERIRRKMTWQLVTIMIGLPASSAIGFFVFMVAAIGGGGRTTGPMIIAIGAGTLALVFCVCYAGLLIRYARALNEALRRTAPAGPEWELTSPVT